jgi:hypothetical protein
VIGVDGMFWGVAVRNAYIDDESRVHGQGHRCDANPLTGRAGASRSRPVESTSQDGEETPARPEASGARANHVFSSNTSLVAIRPPCWSRTLTVPEMPFVT